MFNPAVTSGVDLFVNIFITIVSLVAAISFVDIIRTQKKKEEEA